MTPRLALTAALLGAVLASPARADDGPGVPSTGSFEVRVGNYRPKIDAQAGLTGSPGPYQADFGSGRPTIFWAHGAKALPWHAAGTLELGLGVGYWSAKGHALFEVSGLPSSDRTTFSVVPTELTATWRLDLLWERLSIPLVPYARASLQRYNWWVTGANGSTTKSGATNGYGYGGGLALVLDFLDPMLAREQQADSGVKHTMLTVDLQKTKIDDFGSSSGKSPTRSWDLSNTKTDLTFGLLFVF